MASSSEDDNAASPPVENIMPPQPIMLLPKPPSRVYKTALDVINETIVKTLDSPHPGKNWKIISGKKILENCHEDRRGIVMEYVEGTMKL